MRGRGNDLAEAALLMALTIVPLFVNPYSGRPFDPAKAALLQMLASLLAASWLLAGREEAAESIRREPVAIAATAWMAINLLSTAASIGPMVSITGDHGRAQGVVTTLSYGAVFGAAAFGLRTQARRERATTTIVLASVPVALYAISQSLGLDPLGYRREGPLPSEPVATLGGPMFLGGYLVMAIPFVLVRWLASSGTLDRAALLPAGVYATLLVLELAALFLTQKRGPFLGLLAALSTLAVLVWSRRGRGRAAIWMLAVTTAALLFATAQVPRLRDLGGATARVRVLIWEGALRLALPHAPLWSPLGPDARNGLRPLLGYGPESMYAAFSQVLPRELARFDSPGAKPDRAHNETLDALVENGVLGVLVYLALIATVLHVALRGLGLAVSRRDGIVFLGWTCGTSLVTAAGAAVALGPEYLGAALPGGMILGFLGYVLAAHGGAGSSARAPSEREWVVVALVAAFVGTLVESQFGIATTTTRMHFWLVAGALVAAAGTRSGDPQKGGDAVAVHAVLSGVALAALTFLFVSARRAFDPVGPGIIVTSAVVMLAVMLAESARTSRTPTSWGRPSVRFVGIALGFLLCFAIPHTLLMGRAAAGDPTAHLMALAFFVVLVLVGVLVVARALQLGREEPLGVHARPSLRGIVVAAGAVAVLVVPLARLEGHVLEQLAPQLAAGAVERVRILERARRLQPFADQPLVALADGHLALARAAASERTRASALRRAERALRAARARAPFDPDHAVALARLESVAADLTNGTEKERRLRRALRRYREAARASPTAAGILVEHAAVLDGYARLLDGAGAAAARAEAERLRQRARTIDPRVVGHPLDA